MKGGEGRDAIIEVTAAAEEEGAPQNSKNVNTQITLYVLLYRVQILVLSSQLRVNSHRCVALRRYVIVQYITLHQMSVHDTVHGFFFNIYDI